MIKVKESIPPAKPTSFTRFTATPCAFGWEVSDSDGRPVSEPFEAEWLAREAAAALNEAAVSGPKALAVAFGAIDEFED